MIPALALRARLIGSAGLNRRRSVPVLRAKDDLVLQAHALSRSTRRFSAVLASLTPETTVSTKTPVATETAHLVQIDPEQW